MADPEWLKRARAEGRVLSETAAKPLETPKAKRKPTIAGWWAFRLMVPTVVKSEMNARDHYIVRYKRFKGQGDAVRLAWRMSPIGEPFPEWVGVLTVTLTKVGRGWLDDDNLAGAFKGVRDALAELLGVDDGSDRVKWVYEQKRDGKVPAHVLIDVRSPDAR